MNLSYRMLKGEQNALLILKIYHKMAVVLPNPGVFLGFYFHRPLPGSFQSLKFYGLKEFKNG